MCFQTFVNTPHLLKIYRSMLHSKSARELNWNWKWYKTRRSTTRPPSCRPLRRTPPPDPPPPHPFCGGSRHHHSGSSSSRSDLLISSVRRRNCPGSRSTAQPSPNGRKGSRRSPGGNRSPKHSWFYQTYGPPTVNKPLLNPTTSGQSSHPKHAKPIILPKRKVQTSSRGVGKITGEKSRPRQDPISLRFGPVIPLLARIGIFWGGPRGVCCPQLRGHAPSSRGTPDRHTFSRQSRSPAPPSLRRWWASALFWLAQTVALRYVVLAHSRGSDFPFWEGGGEVGGEARRWLLYGGRRDV